MKVHRACLETARNTSFRHCSCFHVAFFHNTTVSQISEMKILPCKILHLKRDEFYFLKNKTLASVLGKHMSEFCLSVLTDQKKKCILAIINFIHIYQALKVVGVCFLFSKTRWQREKWPLPQINYILKYTWLWCPRVTCSGNLHAPNFTVPDSSICPIAGQTLLLCFYSLYEA